MKRIKYKVLGFQKVFISNSGKEQQQECLVEVRIPVTDASLAKAQAEAYNGEYTIEDDGQPDPEETPTQLDRVEAQATYTAMMTDTLLEV